MTIRGGGCPQLVDEAHRMPFGGPGTNGAGAYVG